MKQKTSNLKIAGLSALILAAYFTGLAVYPLVRPTPVYSPYPENPHYAGTRCASYDWGFDYDVIDTYSPNDGKITTDHRPRQPEAK